MVEPYYSSHLVFYKKKFYEWQKLLKSSFMDKINECEADARNENLCGRSQHF